MASAYRYNQDINPLINLLKESGCFDFDKVWRRLQYKAFNTQYAYIRAFIEFCNKGGFKNPQQAARDAIFRYSNLNSRLLIYYALKFLFKTLGEPFDIYPEEVRHNAEETKIETELKTFTEGEIEKLISTAIDIANSGEPIEVFDYTFLPTYPLWLLLVSTIYGTRRGEFFILTSERIKPEQSAIYIQALKHSTSRKQLIPYGLGDLFEKMKEDIDKKPPDPRYLNTLFDIVQAKADVGIVKKRNIHAIRKTVASILLMRGVNPVFVNDFLRWKGQGTMMAFYVNLDPIFVDTEVFKQHPFVEIWRKEKESLSID